MCGTHGGGPTFYWVAKRDPRDLLLGNLARAIYAWQHGGNGDVSIQPRDWEQAFHMLAQAIGNRRAIVILDELPYALQQDSGLGSHLQAAWDHLFKDSQVIFVLSGSHIGMLTDLIQYQSPLYGRLTAQFPLYALRFADIQPFLPHYDSWQRLAVYAILGGIPAYLERWHDNLSLKTNVERLFLQRTGWFRHEPQLLVSDLTERETVNYEAILKVIAAGHHDRETIASQSAQKSTALSHYLPRLLELQFIERRIPATVPLADLKTSRKTRYYLRDPFLRFYYRFIDPNLHLLDGGLPHHLWQMIEDNFRAFVALTFEEICREWLVSQAQQEKLPFRADNVGSHWSKTVQIDGVAINWQERQLLLGECKWGDAPVSRSVLTELLEVKTPKVLADLPDGGVGWTVHYALFARQSFTEATHLLAAQHQVQLLTLPDVEMLMQAG
jgi:AAA+ ATPase superfamily predicted ATPase